MHRSALATMSGLSERATAQACWRLGRQGILTHAAGPWFTHAFRQASREELSAVLVAPSYASLEWVLQRRGVTTQSCRPMTCATTRHTQLRRTALGDIEYRAIADPLFFGFDLHRTDNGLWWCEAHAEKALLDLVYLSGRAGDAVHLDLDFAAIDPRRLAEYAARFPAWVGGAVAKLRAERGEAVS
jgi:hypothetical protein